MYTCLISISQAALPVNTNGCSMKVKSQLDKMLTQLVQLNMTWHTPN